MEIDEDESTVMDTKEDKLKFQDSKTEEIKIDKKLLGESIFPELEKIDTRELERRETVGKGEQDKDKQLDLPFVGPTLPTEKPSYFMTSIEGEEIKDNSTESKKKLKEILQQVQEVAQVNPNNTINDPNHKPQDGKKPGDSYSECYPSTYESSFNEVYDSDEEDLSKMDQGNKNKLRPWDFETEEDWEHYNETKEATPRAAFQFGVKMADGRRTRRMKDKEKDPKKEAKRKEEKLNRDFQMISNFMKDKKKRDADDVEDNDVGGGDYEDEVPKPSKKQRLIE